MIYPKENTPNAHDTHNTAMPFSRIMNDLENETQRDLEARKGWSSDNRHKLSTIRFLRDIYLYGAGKDKNALGVEEWDKAGLKQVEKTLKKIATHGTLSPEEEEIFNNSFPNGVRDEDVYPHIEKRNYQKAKIVAYGTIGTAASVGVAAGIPLTFMSIFFSAQTMLQGFDISSDKRAQFKYNEAKALFSELADDLTKVITTERLRSNRPAAAAAR